MEQMRQTDCPIKIAVGDIISFTNNAGHTAKIIVKRVEEKSWYALGRNSYGTLVDYSRFPNFKIERKS
jgi:hypothetical protein